MSKWIKVALASLIVVTTLTGCNVEEFTEDSLNMKEIDGQTYKILKESKLKNQDDSDTLANLFVYGNNGCKVELENGELVSYDEYISQLRLAYLDYLLSLEQVVAYESCEIIDYNKIYMSKHTGVRGAISYRPSDYYRLQAMTSDGLLDEIVDKEFITDVSQNKPSIAHIYYTEEIIEVPQEFQWLIDDDKVSGVVYVVLDKE